ncbi:MAG: hypothetical protein P4K93_00265 [Terracidiphilus sp.]|nr:hypothetical protein [Terracidiphilus sp.]
MASGVVAASSLAFAAQLTTDARGAIPHDVQQLVVIDYHAMQNSPAAMNLRNRVMPPELKQFDEALSHSGLNENHDVDELAFALFRPSPGSDALQTVGIAQGQFDTQTIIANFRRQKVKVTMVRGNSVYPMGRTGMMLCFVDPSTMIFGDRDAVTRALDARDGMTASLLTNGSLMNAMQSVDTYPLWSILDEKGTQTMMKQLLGEAAGSVTDFDSVKKRLEASWYSMDFQHGVRFDLTIETGDTFTAATFSSLMSAAVMMRKMSATDAEKQALSDTDIGSSSGKLTVHFATSNAEFDSLLQSPLFKTMVH